MALLLLLLYLRVYVVGTLLWLDKLLPATSLALHKLGMKMQVTRTGRHREMSGPT
ncbi:hypothetical protein SERLADRAFT_481129 [Serpula lacrymans var. lacrymans S7.9]|uniref:Uncharacterized protein n=1 Tax=Serpula lacrymans var. lacrymans (strain S7.9) TaxID=578457 RepID=F8PEK8_SERL9|nr:uncharacterized protein SERLADRAFT_481129 [Serpula lacrymans var. lacrymans S7.9]EGO18459.1 hypothetical protein SERLADRAFT_481129 [Serpula lacrymans var. lacrymans S7.9]